MKKAIVLAAIFLISAHSIQAQAIQEKDVPMLVKESCMKNFPAATNVKWMKKKKNYECNFKRMGTMMHCEMSSTGKILRTGEEIKQSNLPIPVDSYLKTNYKDVPVKSVFKQTYASGKVCYTLIVKGKELYFDDKGTLTSKEQYY